MSVTCPLLGCLVVLFILTVYSVQCKRSETSDVRELLDSKGAILAGEDTPVWLFYRTKDKKAIFYEHQQKGIVGRAVKYWKSEEFQRISRTQRSFNEEVNFNMIKPFNDTSEHGNEKEEANVNTLYPSILVVLEYNDLWPTNVTNQQNWIMEKILYALAFWNGVDLQLRHIPRPKIRLRIAGIVIARGEDHEFQRRDEQKHHISNLKKQLPFLLKYWNQSWIDQFPTNTFSHRSPHDIVAILNDHASTEHGFYRAALSHYMGGVSTEGPPCDSLNRNKLNVLVVIDRLNFGGIQSAVFHIAKILGMGSDNGSRCSKKFPSRYWDPCDLNEIENVLASYGKCMKSPKGYFPPGKPVKTILPGQLMTATKLCNTRGWVDGYVCWVTCEQFYCANDAWYSVCTKSGAPPDGATCDLGKICLDGKCVRSY